MMKNIKLLCVFFTLSSLSISCQELSIEERAEAIKQQIERPTIPNRTFSILDFGAQDNLAHDSSKAFQKAMAASKAAGGGTIVVPKGSYLTGPIHFESHTALHLEEGATVYFKTDPSAYLPVVHTSYEGIELMNYSPLIYAKNKENIAITGSGTLNGQANNQHWWPWAGKDVYGYKEGEPKQHDAHNIPRLHAFNENQIPVEERVFGEGHHIRPTFIQPFESTKILIQGITILNAPFWIIHPLKSSHVTVENVTVISHGPNNDGCDPEYSKNVQILNCVFDTGDDCIAIKSGRNEDGRRVNIPSENILVEGCIMKDGHGGVVMGSEISAGVRNVVVLNCAMDSPNLDRAIRIKTNTLRGGFVDGVYVKNVQIGQVKEAVLKINTYYGIYGVQEGTFIPRIENIYFEDVRAKNGGKHGILIKGREASPVKNIRFERVEIESIKKSPVIENAEPIQLVKSKINGLNNEIK